MYIQKQGHPAKPKKSKKTTTLSLFRKRSDKGVWCILCFVQSVCIIVLYIGNAQYESITDMTILANRKEYQKIIFNLKYLDSIYPERSTDLFQDFIFFRFHCVI